MKNELVSIIVPIYNAEQNLNQCIESIISQTYSNIEIILVNDGSNDNSKKICEQYVLIDKRVRLINQENSGVSSARNQGIKCSKGKYIQFVDSDDYIASDMTYLLVKSLEVTKSHFVISGVDDLQEDSMICSKELLYKTIKNIFENEIITSVWNKLYIKEKIRTGFDEKINYGEDVIFNLKYLAHINRVVLLKRHLYCYQNINPNSLTKKYNSNRLEMSEKVYLQECEYIEKLKWNIKEAKQEVSNIYIKNIIYGLYMESIFNHKQLYSQIIIWSKKESFKNAMTYINYFSSLYILSFLLRLKMKSILKLCFHIRYRIKG